MHSPCPTEGSKQPNLEESTDYSAPTSAYSSSSSNKKRGQAEVPLGGEDSSSSRPASTTSGGNGRHLLYSLLVRDVEPSHGILLPFFSTTDLLRLSECSKDLTPYRHFLSGVRLVFHRLGSHRVKPNIIRLLGRGRLQCLHLSHRALLSWLPDLAASPSMRESLKVLNLSGIEMTVQDAPYVREALLSSSGGGALWSELKELKLSSAGSNMSAVGWNRILEALAGGACPNLERLNLSSNGPRNVPSHAIVAALQSGQLRALQELDLSSTGGGADRWFIPIAGALQSGTCPDLRILKMDCSPGAGEALEQALRSGNLRALRELAVFHAYALFGGGLIRIMAALKTACCPYLSRLEITYAFMAEAEGTALARVLTLGGCQHLQCLDIASSHEPHGVLRILEAMKQGACRELRHMGLVDVQLDREHGKVLGEALQGGMCPKLEELLLSSNKSLGEEGLVHIMAAVEAGGCPRLKRLELSDIGMKALGANALSQALASGHLRGLRFLVLDDNHTIDDDSMAKVLNALGSGTCGGLQSLSLSYNARACKKAGEAVITALRNGAWPRLGHLTFMNKGLRDGWFCELASVLAEVGTGIYLEELRLRCGVSTQGLVKLSQAFRAGACPRLKELYLAGIVREEVDDDSIEEVEKSLEGRAKVDIRKSQAR